MMGSCDSSQITYSDEDDDIVEVGKEHLMMEEEDDDVVIKEAVEEDLGEDEEDDDEGEEAEEEEGDDEYADAMEAMDVDVYTASQSDHESIEEVGGSITPIKKKRISKRRKGVETGLNGLGETMQAAMQFGQELQDDYCDDNREEIKKALEVSS